MLRRFRDLTSEELTNVVYRLANLFNDAPGAWTGWSKRLDDYCHENNRKKISNPDWLKQRSTETWEFWIAKVNG